MSTYALIEKAERALDAATRLINKVGSKMDRDMTEQEFKRKLALELAAAMYDPTKTMHENAVALAGQVRAISDNVF